MRPIARLLRTQHLARAHWPQNDSLLHPTQRQARAAAGALLACE